ncbi:hypothetical protein Ciccas_006332, partial [Cichlidogyrus casuarinus]
MDSLRELEFDFTGSYKNFAHLYACRDSFEAMQDLLNLWVKPLKLRKSHPIDRSRNDPFGSLQVSFVYLTCEFTGWPSLDPSDEEKEFDPSAEFSFRKVFKSVSDFREWIKDFQKKHNFKYSTQTLSQRYSYIKADYICTKQGCPSRIQGKSGRDSRTLVSYTPHNHSPDDLSRSQVRDNFKLALDEGMTPNQVFMKFLYENRLGSLDQLTGDLIPRAESVRHTHKNNKKRYGVKDSILAEKLVQRSYRTSDRILSLPFKEKFAKAARDRSPQLTEAEKQKKSTIAMIVAAANAKKKHQHDYSSVS